MIKVGLLQRERQTKLNSQISAKSDIWFFEKLLLKDSLYFIVFANILIKLMRENVFIKGCFTIRVHFC